MDLRIENNKKHRIIKNRLIHENAEKITNLPPPQIRDINSNNNNNNSNNSNSNNIITNNIINSYDSNIKESNTSNTTITTNDSNIISNSNKSNISNNIVSSQQQKQLISPAPLVSPALRSPMPPSISNRASIISPNQRVSFAFQSPNIQSPPPSLDENYAINSSNQSKSLSLLELLAKQKQNLQSNEQSVLSPHRTFVNDSDPGSNSSNNSSNIQVSSPPIINQNLLNQQLQFQMLQHQQQQQNEQEQLRLQLQKENQDRLQAHQDHQSRLRLDSYLFNLEQQLSIQKQLLDFSNEKKIVPIRQVMPSNIPQSNYNIQDLTPITFQSVPKYIKSNETNQDYAKPSNNIISEITKTILPKTAANTESHQMSNLDKINKKQSYMDDLARQIEDKERRKKELKKQEQEYDQKKDKEIKYYDPFGKPGAGSPLRDNNGKVIASLNNIKSSAVPTTQDSGYAIIEKVKSPQQINLRKSGEKEREVENRFDSEIQSEKKSFAHKHMFKDQNDQQILAKQNANEELRRELKIQMEEKEKRKRLQMVYNNRIYYI